MEAGQLETWDFPEKHHRGHNNCWGNGLPHIERTDGSVRRSMQKLGIDLFTQSPGDAQYRMTAEFEFVLHANR